MELKSLLEELAATKLVKVTGSYADGTQSDESDIDFKIRDAHPEMSASDPKRPMQRILDIMAKHDIKWRSTLPGYIFTHMTSGNGHLPKQLEFSDLFHPRKNRIKEVEIEGVLFKTY